jgi:PhnB protein
MKNFILHATLTQGSFILMGTDLVSDDGLHRGNSISLILNCKSEKEIRKFYDLLAQGGTAKYPLENTFWGAMFGGLKDKYGHHWILNYNKPVKS